MDGTTGRAGGLTGGPTANVYPALPWLFLVMLLLAAGLWILVQPMDMRGTMQMLGLPVTGG